MTSSVRRRRWFVFGEQRLQCSVLHPVLVHAEIVKDLGVAGGGAGQKTLFVNSHQPLLGVGIHAGGHVLLGPSVQPGLKAPVQASVDPLVGLKERSTTQISRRSKCPRTGRETCNRINNVGCIYSAHLMSPCQCRVSVHVIFWLADINHLVGVELEHALDLQLAVVFKRLVRGDPGHFLLLQLLPSSLAPPDPSQVPEGRSRRTTINNTDWSPSKSSDYCTQKGVHQVYRESSHKFYNKNRECV